MRAPLFALAVLAASASPAPAQVDPFRFARENELMMQQQALQQRQVAVETQIQALEGRVATEQRLRELDAQRYSPAVRIPSDPALNPQRPPPQASGGFASIPDDRLAASNARVREASRNRD